MGVNWIQLREVINRWSEVQKTWKKKTAHLFNPKAKLNVDVIMLKAMEQRENKLFLCYTDIQDKIKQALQKRQDIRK